MQLEKTYELPFAVDVVYSAWVSSATVIPPATAMDVKPEVGGHYRLIMETADFTGRNDGVFSRVEPNQRVTYTWQWNNDGEVTEIDVRFCKVGSGTRLELRHSGFQSQNSVDNHDMGWDSYIQGFTDYLRAR